MKRNVLWMVGLLAVASVGCNDDNDENTYVAPDGGHDGGIDGGSVHLDGGLDAASPLDGGRADSGT